MHQIPLSLYIPYPTTCKSLCGVSYGFTLQRTISSSLESVEGTLLRSLNQDHLLPRFKLGQTACVSFSSEENS